MISKRKARRAARWLERKNQNRIPSFEERENRLRLANEVRGGKKDGTFHQINSLRRKEVTAGGNVSREERKKKKRGGGGEGGGRRKRTLYAHLF